jgi:hypothetical protein
MKKRFGVWMTLLLAAIVCCGILVSKAQTADIKGQNTGPSDQEIQDMARTMGMDPKLCEDLQERINKIVAISDSSLTDQEKVDKLSETVAESIAGMQTAGSKDAEVANAANQYLVLMKDIMSAARSSAAKGDSKVSAATKEDLQKLLVITKTYMAMMKIMCPKLALPDTMNK